MKYSLIHLHESIHHQRARSRVDSSTARSNDVEWRGTRTRKAGEFKREIKKKFPVSFSHSFASPESQSQWKLLQQFLKTRKKKLLLSQRIYLFLCCVDGKLNIICTQRENITLIKKKREFPLFSSYSPSNHLRDVGWFCCCCGGVECHVRLRWVPFCCLLSFVTLSSSEREIEMCVKAIKLKFYFTVLHMRVIEFPIYNWQNRGEEFGVQPFHVSHAPTVSRIRFVAGSYNRHKLSSTRSLPHSILSRSLCSFFIFFHPSCSPSWSENSRRNCEKWSRSL